MTLWLRPTSGLTIVLALPRQKHNLGFGWNWRGRVWGVWHDVGSAFWRWHTPPNLEPIPEPPEGYELGIADDGRLIHVPIAAPPARRV